MQHPIKQGDWQSHKGEPYPPFALAALTTMQFVEIQFRDGESAQFHRDSIEALVWAHTQRQDDIVAFRVCTYPETVTVDYDLDPMVSKKLLDAALDDKAYLQSKLKALSNNDHMSTYQSRVRDWVKACFGSDIADCKPERNHRFLEEALELVQALGCTRDEAHKLVDYTFDRPVGNPGQEVGGVMVTLAALCGANDISFALEAETELGRICEPEIINKIRLKQSAKPSMSPLPEAVYSEREPYAGTQHYIRQIEKLERDNESLREHNESLARHVICAHEDDRAVNVFAGAMKEKMAIARSKGRSGWDNVDECTDVYLAELLVESVQKGDPVDVGNFAMMLHNRRASNQVLIDAFIAAAAYDKWKSAVKDYMNSVPCIPAWCFDDTDPDLTMFSAGNAINQYVRRIEQDTRSLKTAVNYVKWLYDNDRGTSMSTFTDEFGYEPEGAAIAYEFCLEFIGAVNVLLSEGATSEEIGQNNNMAGQTGLIAKMALIRNMVMVNAAEPIKHEPRQQRPERTQGRRATDAEINERKCYLQSPGVIPNSPVEKSF